MTNFSSAAPTAGTVSSGRVLTILGFVFGGLAVLFLPILFGPAGIACAAVGMSKGDRLARWALAVAIAGMVVGFALGFLVYASRT